MRDELPTIERVPPEMSARLTELGRVWAEARERPRMPSEVKQSWDQLLSAWIDSDLPLVIRKSGGVRGAEIVHKTTSSSFSGHSSSRWVTRWTAPRTARRRMAISLGRPDVPPTLAGPRLRPAGISRPPFQVFARLFVNSVP